MKALDLYTYVLYTKVTVKDLFYLHKSLCSKKASDSTAATCSAVAKVLPKFNIAG